MAYTTIDKPTDYFRTKLYTGNNGSQSITFDEDTNMTPDWSWFKTRNRAADSSIMDVVRGVRKSLTSNNVEGEYTESSGLSSWNTNGFSFDGPGFDLVNSSNTFASWHWLAANGTSSNSDGAITSTVSANTTAGFSIVSYTGTGNSNNTVGHGLNQALDLLIIKNRDRSAGWKIGSTALSGNGFNYSLGFDTGGEGSNSNPFNNTAPTSSIFTIANGSYADTNQSGEKFIAYCFHSVKGYSKIGRYTGNGNANGTFVYTGFKPAFVLVKITSGTDNWILMDNKRLGYNKDNYQLIPNSALADQTPERADLLSNGFKARSTNGEVNSSGSTYLYMAFAENPFVTSTAIPAPAR